MNYNDVYALITEEIAAAQTSDWIAVASLLVTATALLAALWQITKLSVQIADAKKVYLDDHLRARRERTAEVVQYFNDRSTTEHGNMLEFLDNVEEEQIKKMMRREPIALSGEMKELACAALRTQFPDIYERYCGNSGKRKFTKPETMHLSYIMRDLLNHYEICLLPWFLNTVDRDVIEKQFYVLVAKQEGKFRLERVRGIIGDEKFPATTSFKQKLFPETESKLSPLERTGKG